MYTRASTENVVETSSATTGDTRLTSTTHSCRRRCQKRTFQSEFQKRRRRTIACLRIGGSDIHSERSAFFFQVRNDDVTPDLDFQILENRRHLLASTVAFDRLFRTHSRRRNCSLGGAVADSRKARGVGTTAGARTSRETVGNLHATEI